MNRTRQVRMNAARLLWRQYVADRGAAWTVIVVVFLLALAAALAPRALDRMYTDDLHSSVANTPASFRDLTSVSPVAPPLASGTDPWEPMRTALLDVRADGDPVVQEVLGEPRYFSSLPEMDTERGGSEASLTSFLVADPHFDELVDVVEGTAPAASASKADPVIEVMVSRASADMFAWQVGEERDVESTAIVAPFRMRLAGVYEIRDETADAWAHRRAAIEPDVSDDFNLGLRYTSAAYVDPTSYSAVLERFASSSTRIWFPVDLSGKTASDTAAARDSLARFTSRAYDLSIGAEPAATSYRTVSELSFATEMLSVLDTVEDRRLASAAILAIVAAGPVGVALAVMTLATRLMIERRRSSLALVSARGASSTQFRLWLGAEGLAIGIPAAAAAWLSATMIVPASASVLGVVLPILVGLSPALLLPVAGRAGSLRVSRRDLGLARPSKARRFVEVLVVVAAIASASALNIRGLDSSDGRVDPLLAATPLLIAFAVTMVMMRLYPAPIAAIGRRLRRSKSTVAYLGTARAMRDPAGGLVPMLALVVGLSIAAFSVVMWSTTESGLEATARHEVGADARIVGSPPTEEQLTAAAEVPGVEHVLPVSTPGPLRFQVGPDITRYPLTATDLDGLAEIHRGEDVATATVPSGLVGLTADGAIPIATSSDGPEIGTVGQLHFRGQNVDAVVVEHVDEMAGINPAGASWFLADRATLAHAGVPTSTIRTILVEATTGADPDYDAVRTALGGSGQVTTPGDVAAALRGPVNEGTTVAIVAAIALTGLLCAASVVLTLVVSAPSRDRLLAQLRTLGLTGRQGEGLVAWETAPVAVASLGAGLALGVTLPWLILGGVDLTALTGGSSQPAIELPFGLLLALLAAFVVVVAAAVGGSVLAGRRLRPATVLRVGDDE